MFEYIEMFYNSQRKHTNNGMLSPVEFEQQHKMNAEGVWQMMGTLQAFKPNLSMGADYATIRALIR